MTGQSIASWNIHKGVGTDRRRDLNRTAAVIGEIAPDIMALQEADTRFGTRTGLLDMEALAREHGLAAVPGVGPAHGWHGNVLLLRETEIVAIHRINLPGLEARGALIADLNHAGQPLRVIAAHLGLLPGSRAAQARHLVQLLAGMDARPTLMMGDLNEWRVGGSAAMRHLTGYFQNSVALPSFPARYPLVPLDRMMVSTPAHLSDASVHDTPLARRASDHLPIKARLHLPLL
ncbi:MAG: endonuclease/exonuclease/phosphatase family protein [Paracoccaceae bacterium]